MDVTKENFDDITTTIEKDINDCLFAAIDCEFTGLELPEPLHPLDSSAKRYEKLFQGVPDYLVLQIGLSLWRLDGEKFYVKTYNIYTYPEKQKFFAQSSSLNFLIESGFDLNRCIRSGVPFRRLSDMNAERIQMRTRHMSGFSNLLNVRQEAISDFLDKHSTLEDLLKLNGSPKISFTTEDFRHAEVYYRTHEKLIEEWITRPPSDDSQSECDELILPPCSDLIRTSFFILVERVHFSKPFRMESVRMDGIEYRNQKKVKFCRDPKSPLDRLLHAVSEEIRLSEKSFGVSKLMFKLSESNKPIVAHNAIRDIMHCISQFFGPLPREFSDFKTDCLSLFHTIFDTKYMSMQPPLKTHFRGTCLRDLFEQVRSNSQTFPVPEICVEEGYGYDELQKRDHEAGFDAWMTGFIFAAFFQFINNGDSPLWESPQWRQLNLKLHFGQSLDICAFDLNRSLEHLNRSDVYVVEWDHSGDRELAKQIVTRSGGSKKIAFGEKFCLAFRPLMTSTCEAFLKSAPHLIKPCRFYKFDPSPKATKTSKRRRRLRSLINAFAPVEHVSRESSPASPAEEGDPQKKTKISRSGNVPREDDKGTTSTNKFEQLFQEKDW